MKPADIHTVVHPLLDWWGPFGGLPPLDHATPQAVEQAYLGAIETKRREIVAIARDPRAPDFLNTVEAMERSGSALRRAQCLLDVMASTMSTGEAPLVVQRLAPLAAELDDAIAHDHVLFSRVEAVFSARKESGLSEQQQRLVEVVRERMMRRGAGLEEEKKGELARINAELATSIAAFNRNLLAEQDSQCLLFDDEGCLEGLPGPLRAGMARVADERGSPGRWAVPNQRPFVWPFLTGSVRRDLRERVWRMWSMRGCNPGPYDNRPIIARILRLRGEKARVFGYRDFARYALAERMARTPENALALLHRVWDKAVGPTRTRIAEMQAVVDEEGGGFALAPWDRLHYAEKLRRSRLEVDAGLVAAHLPLDSVVRAMFWLAGRLYGLVFERLTDAPTGFQDIEAYGVTRDGAPLGALYLDMFEREGKQRGSFQREYRAAETGRILPVSSINTSFPRGKDGGSPLLSWEYANVLFHEFGHALHMLCSRAGYPSLGSLQVPWDFIELPALLNERWLADRELLERFARHHDSGEPLPESLLAGIEATASHDRPFSLNLDYLAPAIVDLELHLLADGRELDAVAEEERILGELGMPGAWDSIMRVTHSVHSFSEAYAAGVYVYLWADVMAADAAQAFRDAPGGMYDAEVAARWHDTVLSAGNLVRADEAFRRFRGRDPDAGVLMRHYGLAGE